LVNRYLEPAEILALMPYFDLAISMKFHGLIFPMAAGVPVMNLGTSKKNQDLAKQMGLVSLSPEELTVSSFLQTLKQVESLEYTTSVAETQRLARESILTAFAQPRLWD
jgi:polysaccharide pyruvyl transferase WcaK-like protein